MLRAVDIFMIPFSLLWGGFAFFWEYTAFTSGAPLFFLLWGLPFVSIGLYMIAGRFIFDAMQRSRTYYALTDERVLLVSGIKTTAVKSISLRHLPELGLNEGSHGEGSIYFGGNQSAASIASSVSFLPGTVTGMQFVSIPEARKVYERIRQAQAMI